MSLELAPAFEVVPADAVEAVARSLRNELDALAVELAATRDETEVVRHLVRSIPAIDAETSEQLQERVRRFVDDWLRRDEQALRDAVDSARVRAGDRVRLAEVEAGAIVAAAREAVAAAPVLPPPPTIVPPAALRLPAPMPLDSPLAVVPASEPARPQPQIEAEAAPTVPEAAVVADLPSPPPEVAAGGLDALLAAVLDALDRNEPTALDALNPPSPAVEPVTSGPASGTVDTPAAAEDTASLGGRRRVPIDVLLPMIGVVVVVALLLLLIG